MQISNLFKHSKENISIYAEPLINDRLMNPNEKFSDRMKMKNPGSFSIISCNTKLGESAKWNTVGGNAITLDANLLSHMEHQGYGKDKSGLGRWTWCRIRGCDNIFTRFISAYRPCRNTTSMLGCWAQQIFFLGTNLI